MKKIIVHKVGVSSVGRLVGTWAGIVGLFTGIIGSIVSLSSIFDQNNLGLFEGLGVSALVIIGWLVLYPLLLFVIGWLQGVVFALIFNIVIAGAGGLSLDVDEEPVAKLPVVK